MTTNITNKLWSEIDENQAQKLNGGLTLRGRDINIASVSGAAIQINGESGIQNNYYITIIFGSRNRNRR